MHIYRHRYIELLPARARRLQLYSRVGLAEDEHGAVGEDLPRLVGLLLLQIFLLLTELEVVAVDVVHWRGRMVTRPCV